MDATSNLNLPFIIAAQAQKHVTHNEALRALDAVVQLAVLDKDLNSPPGSPEDGARYIVAASPTGAWSGHAGKIAAYQDGAWAFYAPREGWLAWAADEDGLHVWTGSAWTAFSGGGGGDGLANVVEDTTPQLGGDLDANGHDIGFDDGTGIADDAGNEQVTFHKTASAVNQVGITNAATGNPPVVAAEGGDTNIKLRLAGKGNLGVESAGTQTNDSAPAGFVGEIIAGSLAIASATGLTNNTAKTVVSISLTPGDWDVSGVVVFQEGGSTVTTQIKAGISTTTNTMPGNDSGAMSAVAFGSGKTGGNADFLPTPVTRLSLASTTTVYLVALALFTTSSCDVSGQIRARRVR